MIKRLFFCVIVILNIVAINSQVIAQALNGPVADPGQPTEKTPADGGSLNSYMCSSGGQGSTKCSTSVTGGIQGSGGGTSCSVECSAGWYACCNAWKNKCQCRKNK